MAYSLTNFTDGQNKYTIKDQSDNVIHADTKLVYSGTGGTAISSTVLNKMETGIYNALYPGKVEKVAWPTKKIPAGLPAMFCDGTAVSRTTYADLFEAICPSQTFTVSIATPAVFTAVGHGLSNGDALRFTTTGALPTGLNTTTTYYVIATGLTSDAFQVSTSRGGSAVNTSGTQSGTHTLRCFNWGIGDGSTTFNIPDHRGVVARGTDDGKGYDMDTYKYVGKYQADANKAHAHSGSSIPSGGEHGHTLQAFSGGSSNYLRGVCDAGNTPTSTTNAVISTGSSHSHSLSIASDGSTESVMKNIGFRYVIYY
jgi:microcystin-dependent protein